jgi:hypothetical protein
METKKLLNELRETGCVLVPAVLGDDIARVAHVEGRR